MNNYIRLGKDNVRKGLWCAVFAVLSSVLYAQPQVNSDGYNVFYYSGGQKASEGPMREGKPDGYWKTYYENGNLKTEGNRRDFQLDSLWKFYDEKGQLNSEITYREGKKNGVSRIYNEGVLISETHYADNVKEGPVLFFYPDGKLKRQENYVSNGLQGEVKEFDSTGNIITLEEYHQGNLINQRRVNRLDEEGRKTGKWLEFYPNGKIKSEAEYSGGIQTGYFKEYDTRGNLKVLEKYEEGEKQEEAEEIVFIDIRTTYHPNGRPHFIGGYTDGKKNGIFREYSDSGALVQSYIYRRDLLLSEGIVDEMGNYQGDWKLYYPDGTLRAEGRYEEGLRVDEWKFYHPNSKIEQKGKYVKGKPHGLWLWTYANGQLQRDETYRYGKEEGTVIEYDSLGNVLAKGDYIDGYRDGEWFYHVGDHIEKGKYRDGERDGEWVYIYDNEKKAFEGKYVNGLAEGRHRYYYYNGKIRLEGRYKQGLKEGLWKNYDEQGNVRLTVEYKRGVATRFDGVKVKETMEPHKINAVDQ